MQNRERYAQGDPRQHTNKIRGMLSDVMNHAREDVGKVDDPGAQALFETTAKVFQGPITAYAHYESGTEEAWRSRTPGRASS